MTPTRVTRGGSLVERLVNLALTKTILGIEL